MTKWKLEVEVRSWKLEVRSNSQYNYSDFDIPYSTSSCYFDIRYSIFITRLFKSPALNEICCSSPDEWEISSCLPSSIRTIPVFLIYSFLRNIVIPKPRDGERYF